MKSRQNVVKIPEWVDENAEYLRKQLIKHGLDSLPEEIIEPSRCPLCGSKLKEYKLRNIYLKCENCGYSQQSFLSSTNFSKGVILGLGIATTIYLLKNIKTLQR